MLKDRGKSTCEESTAVIGAGPSGIVACKTLKERGLPFTCFEAGNRVGGQWVFDNPSGTSSVYRSLKTNINKGMIHRGSDRPRNFK